MDLHSTDELVGMIEALDRPQGVLLGMFFPNEQTFDTEEVHFDKIDRARRLAPFVSPLVAGKPLRSRGYETKSFKPAYVKPKHIVEPNKAMKRRAGEALTGSMTPAERFDMATTDNLRLEDEEIMRREEWMASEALRTGSITVSGDDYPTQVIDYGRDASLTKALLTTARWGESGVSPFANIRTWASEVASKSGAHPRTVVMDPLAADLFQKDADLRAVLDLRRQMPGDLQFLGQATGAQGEEVAYLGSTGQFDFYQYSQVYTDEDGAEQNIMPSYTVILGARTLCEGIRLYGAIQDRKALRAMSRFPKMWEQEDPSVVYTMTQSAPLPVLGRPNATCCVTVR